jgi:hypothetical protein
VEGARTPILRAYTALRAIQSRRRARGKPLMNPPPSASGRQTSRRCRHYVTWSLRQIAEKPGVASSQGTDANASALLSLLLSLLLRSAWITAFPRKPKGTGNAKASPYRTQRPPQGLAFDVCGRRPFLPHRGGQGPLFRFSSPVECTDSGCRTFRGCWCSCSWKCQHGPGDSAGTLLEGRRTGALASLLYACNGLHSA